VRKTHTSSARSAGHQTLADKHKQKINRAKQNSFAPKNWGPPEIRPKLDPKTLQHKPFQQQFCAAAAFGGAKLDDRKTTTKNTTTNGLFVDQKRPSFT